MKHSWKITGILLIMFFVTQLIGIAVINSYTPQIETVTINGTEQNITINPLPFGLTTPEVPKEDFKLNLQFLVTLILLFVVSISLVFFLTKIKSVLFLRIWFFVVVIMALGITLNALFFNLKIPYASTLALIIALPLAIVKIFRRNILVHNFTELMIYPGIAAVFVPILNIWTVILLLILISAYDIWAVWHSGFMQKMAKFQIDKLKLFSGFFIPTMSKKDKDKIQKINQKYKNIKTAEKHFKKQKIKVSLAILGGGDVIFPIIAAGIFLRVFGIIPALSITLFSTIALFSLFYYAKKGKFYPAMPFLTAGIFLGMIVGYLIRFI